MVSWLASKTDAPHLGAEAVIDGSNQRTMGERPDFNGLARLGSGIPNSVPKPFSQGDLRSTVRETS